jgi:hypothetical protein
MYIYDNASLNYSKNEKCFDKSWGENKKKHILCSIFPPKNLAVNETMWKSMVEPDRPQLTTKHGACALHAG